MTDSQEQIALLADLIERTADDDDITGYWVPETHVAWIAPLMNRDPDDISNAAHQDPLEGRTV